MIKGQGEIKQTKEGAMRESNDGRGRFDLLPYEALEAWAKWSEEGGKKYGDRNWEQGISVKDCINRMVRHATKASNGWTDEDHLAAVIWNAAAAITMMKRRPDCNDHRWLKTNPSLLFNNDDLKMHITIDGEMVDEYARFIVDASKEIIVNGVSIYLEAGDYKVKDILDKMIYNKPDIDEDDSSHPADSLHPRSGSVSAEPPKENNNYWGANYCDGRR